MAAWELLGRLPWVAAASVAGDGSAGVRLEALSQNSKNGWLWWSGATQQTQVFRGLAALDPGHPTPDIERDF